MPIRNALVSLVATAPIWCATAASLGSVLYVRADARPGGNGASWASAMNDLQAALAAATPESGVTAVWVAAGNYTPSANDATVSFVMRSGLGLYGGFGGTETSLLQRDIDAHPTVLNGDLGGDDIVGSGAYWYSNWNIVTANSGHIVRADGTNATAVLDGFTLENGATGPSGTPAGSEFMFGGGLYCVGGSPTIRNCTFRHCLAAFATGGGMYLWNSNASVTNCRFIENYGHLADGAGLFVGGASQPVIEDCLFQYNVVVADQPDAQGGGMATWSSLPMAVRRCDFLNNLGKTFYAGSLVPVYGGGLFSFNQPITIAECRFIGNTARLGGGLASFGATTIINCLFRDNIAVPDVGGQGAAAWLWGNSGVVSSFINSTASFNDGTEYAVHSAFSGTVQVRNSVLWGNTASNPELAGGYKSQIGGSFNAKHSCIQHIFDPSQPGEDPIDLENLPGCTDLNPLFVSATDFHLSPGSPCIDSGKNSYVPVGVTLDLDGLLRFIDDPAAPNSGSGTPPVDMGCFERSSVPPCVPADFDCDGDVDAADLAVLLAAWGTGGQADLNGSGTVNAADLAMLLAAWG
ncbi:MAG: right-handed parallel beta-helix repeat-containing protein [Phycisphaerae bacterium]|jgi:hypothetical protein|nr:right-handed parallel beta-helix repeat-containing protein [Phycisphaerae bacterium]